MKTPGPAVLLLSADEAELASWAAALAGAAQVRMVRDLDAFAIALAAEPADVVVAPCDAVLLEGIQRFRGDARLVLCGISVPASVLDAAGQGYDLRHIDKPEGLRREVHALARPRSLNVRHALPGLSVSWEGALRSAAILDISNGGFSFRFELDDELERLLPGTVLDAVEVYRGPALALAAESAAVRYIEQISLPAESPYYRIGCELAPAMLAQQGPTRPLRITDGAARAGLLRAALRTAGIFLQTQDAPAVGVLCASGQVDIERGEVSLEAQLCPFGPFDVVRGTFELGGGSYNFVTSVMSVAPLRLRLPTSIDAAHRRSSARFRPDPLQPVSVELHSPLFPSGPVRRAALELSSTGFSFAMDPEVDLFPPGMRLPQLELRLGELSLRCSGEVKNIAPLPGETRWRCGVEFEGLDGAARGQLADAVMRNRYPGLIDASALGFPELWKFFQETGFLYPAKLAALAPILPEVQRTFERLHARQNRIFKSLVYRDGGNTLVHASCLRAYRRTWVLQHLAGSTRLSRKPAPQILNLGLAEYFGQTTELEYLKFYFRPDNSWPARVFGGFARKVSDKQLSDLRTFHYVIVPTDGLLQASPSVRVIEASGADLTHVERHLVAAERGLLLRSDDLTRASLQLDEVDASFRELGLYRKRQVLLALRGGVPVGYALCELSSPGLNLSELLSTFRVEVLPSASGNADPGSEEHTRLCGEARAALIRQALQIYRRAGRPSAVALVREKDEGLAAYPALQHKQYTCWTVHRTLYRRFCEHIDRVYDLLSRNRRRRESEGNVSGVPHGEPVRGDAA